MENLPGFRLDPSLKLMDRVDQALSYYQYADRTRLAYRRWTKEYITYLGVRKVPRDRFQKEIGSFLRHLVREKKLSQASQNQARNAIVFLYKRVFDINIKSKNEPLKKRTQSSLPLVMTQREVRLIFLHLKGKHLLMAKLMYGSGLRLMECVRLRVHHLDFSSNAIHVQSINEGKKRTTVMPETLRQDLLNQVEAVKKIHARDIERGYAHPMRAKTLLNKYPGKEYRGDKYPEADKDLAMQYIFPAKKILMDSSTGLSHRPCVLESGLQKAIKTAVIRSGIQKAVSASTFRHSFATHLLENNVNIYTVKNFMGHTDIRSTQVYIQVMEKKADVVLSPLDAL